MQRNQSYDAYNPRINVKPTYGNYSQINVSGAIPGNLQPRSSRNSSLTENHRENRLISNPVPRGLEDSLDKFEKQSRLENHPSVNYGSHGYFSPTYGYTPATIASLGGSPVKKETNSGFNLAGGAGSNTNQEEPIKSTSRVGGIGNTHSNRSSNADELHSQIMLKQRALEKQFEQSKRLKSYNIVTNQVSNATPSVLEGLPFGYAVRSLERNLEDINTEAVIRAKGIDRSTTLSPKKQESRAYQNTYEKNAAIPAGFVAGKNNFYGETEFRYANKLPQLEPLQQNQYYSAKALKNMSGLKLY